MIAAMLALSLQLLVGVHGPRQPRPRAPSTGLPPTRSISSRRPARRCSILVTLPAGRCGRRRWRRCSVGALSLRTRGFFFLMVTLAFGQMVFFLFHDTKLGGGTDGAFLAAPAALALRTGSCRSTPRASGRWPAYYVALALLVAMYLVLVLLLRSLFGRVLEGIRVNEHRMQALGFDTYRYKLAAFVHRRHAGGRRRSHVGACTAAS